MRKTDGKLKTKKVEKLGKLKKSDEKSEKKWEEKSEKQWNKKGGARLAQSAVRRAAAACVLAAVLCTGCGSQDGMPSDISASDKTYGNGSSWSGATGVYGEAAEGFGSGSAGGDGWESSNSPSADNTDITVDTDRKLIKTVSLSVETKEFEQAVGTLETQVRQLGGYIEKMETYNGSRYSGYSSVRYSNMTVRIPKEKLSDFLETVSGVCNVTRRNDDLKDVTLSYVDTESRRDTLRTEQERLLSFLEKAQTVEEIIALEQRLSDVRYQLESMEARLRTMDNQVDFATVYLDISEVKELTPVQEQTAWERLGEGFMGSIRDIGDGFVNFGIWFAINIPYLVIWAAVITAAVLIIRKVSRRSREKRLARAAKADAEWKAARDSRLQNGQAPEDRTQNSQSSK